MLKTKTREVIASALLTTLLSVGVALGASWIAVSRGQAVHENRLTTLETTTRDDRQTQTTAIDKAEERLNKRLDSIQTDVREVRDGQNQILRAVANREQR